MIVCAVVVVNVEYYNSSFGFHPLGTDKLSIDIFQFEDVLLYSSVSFMEHVKIQPVQRIIELIKFNTKVQYVKF